MTHSRNIGHDKDKVIKQAKAIATYTGAFARHEDFYIGRLVLDDSYIYTSYCKADIDLWHVSGLTDLFRWNGKRWVHTVIETA